jgi:hypothetical protein
MKFKNIYKKCLVIVLSILILSGCENKIDSTPTIENNNIENNTSENNNIEDNDIKNDEDIESNTKDEEYLEEYNDCDNLVINKFKNVLDEVKEDDSTLKDKAKSIFISIVDFIFLDGEIDGVKFNDLTDKGKQEVLKIANNIDDKIESKIPNYKTTIKNDYNIATDKIKEIIKNGANNINDFTKEKLSESDYNNLVKSKDDIIYYSKGAINLLTGVTKEAYEKVKNIKDWYNNFKNN